MKKLFLLAIFSSAVSFSSFAQTIAQWTFESSVPTNAGPYAAEVGAGLASGFHAGAAVYSNPAGNGSVESFSSTAWAIGDYYQFSTSTLGFTGISVSYDQASSGTGPGQFYLAYSLDGSNFTPFGNTNSILVNGSPNVAWTSATYTNGYFYSYDLTSVSSLNNAATVTFRLIDASTLSANGGTVAASGTDRVDNFTVAVIPEPSSLVLLAGLGLLGLITKLRRK